MKELLLLDSMLPRKKSFLP